MLDLRERLGIDYPIVQAGFAGGLADSELASAVSRAGALGTLGLVPASDLRAEIARAREMAPKRPLAVGLLMPFTRRAHVDVCVEARPAAVILFFGFAADAVRRLRQAGIFVMHQVGTADEARRALVEGADAVVAQGREAGGHLMGITSAREALRELLEVADGAPVLLAGGVASAEDVRRAMGAGAAGVVCGSRFLLTEECGAHPGYKARILGAPVTLETTLFGFGWPDRHRVVPNAATDRWCRTSPAGPPVVRSLKGWSRAFTRVLPLGRGSGAVRLQRLGIPLYTPASVRRGDDERVLDVTPLYAGECVREIRSVLPAAEVVRELAAGCAS
jgi:NAD(P)H-dependent flavin oxidoreductase YrpB (nitropropane dioxygenase family)